MAKGEKRLTIEGLIPGEKYAIQVRAVDTDDTSAWSNKHNFETIDDTAGGTRTPAPPALKEWKVDASGQYIAIWDNIKVNTDGTPAVVKMYELGLTAGGPEVVVPHYGQTALEQTRVFNFGHLRSLFGGTIPTTISARLRMVNSAGTISEWSEPAVASLPVPNPPKNVTGQPVVDGIKVKWEPPDDPIHLVGYRVYLSMVDPDFVPNWTNMVYQGAATEFTYTSLSYDFDHWFKVVSYSEPGLESTTVNPVPTPNRPISPYGPDDVAPLKPTLADPTMDRSTVTAPKANLTWTIEEAAAENQDISGFVVRWRIAGGTDGWRNAYFDKAARAGVIDLPQPFANYEFEIAAYDFVANYSSYDGTLKTLTGATAPPSVVTGLSGVPRWDGIRIVWDESNESVKFGGHYQVQINNVSPASEGNTYTTSNTFIDITGLTSLTEYFYRVRAIDSAGQASPWSSDVSSTLPAFPAANATDGVAPSAAPTNVRATGGLNYVNVAWDRVTNADSVWYEVFMDDATGVTADAANFVGESSGTSLMVASLPDGSPLQQETQYYFKVRAVDADNPGPLSTEVSSVLTQVLSTDLGINMGGENLLYNSSFETDSDGNGVANYWQVVNTSSGAEPHVPSLVSGRAGGIAQRIQWTGVATSPKGVRSKDAPVLRGNTEYVFSIYARGNGGTVEIQSTPAMVGVTVLEQPDLSTTEFRRFIFRATTNLAFDQTNVSFVNTGNPNTNGWIEFDDAQIEAGNVASAYKEGTVSIAKLITGRFTSADLIISTGGRVVSETYMANPATGFLITDSGITIKDGQVDAKTLVANSTITNNLYVGALLEMASGGLIRSANYNPGVAGYSLSSVGLDIRSGTVGAGTLVAGTISSPDIRVGSGGKITIDANGSIVSNNYNGPSDAGTNAGFKISNTGIEMWDANSRIDVNALETSTMTARTITIGSGGTIQSAGWASLGPVRWQLAENAFTMVGGTITGSTIITDQLYSASSEVSPDGVTRRKFSINAQGYAEFSGARVYGNMLVGTHAGNVIQSGNYNAVNAGWQIRGDGLATFMQVQTWNLNVYASAKVGGDASHSISSASFAYSSAGWIIRGDGYAEFNGGSFRVGGSGGSLIWILDGGGAQGQIRFYLPGTVPNDGNGFNYIRARDWHCFEIRGAHGGAIEMYSGAAWDGHSLVRLIQDAHVTQTMWIDNGLYLGGGLSVNSGGVTMAYLGGSGRRYVHVGNGGVLDKGEAASSSERYKKNIETLTYTKKEVLSLRPVHYEIRDEYKIEGVDRDRYAGFIAEEAEAAGLGDFVIYEEGRVESFDYAHFTAAQQVVLRAHDEEIAELKSEVEELKRMLRLALDK